MLKIILTLSLFILCLYAKESIDVTKELKFIGNPYSKQFKTTESIYSKNIWDMQVYNNLLFIGAGNSANEGPSINSGALDLISYNPATKQFNQESTIYDNQVDIFNVIDNKLFIPGHDATGSWEFGNFYTRENNTSWKMHRNIPKALHVYDLAEHNGKLFAGIGLNEGAAVGITDDLGKNWKILKLGSSRVYSFLSIGNELFALKKFKRTSRPYFSVAQYQNDETFSPRYDISIYTFFPDTKFDIKYSRATRIISFQNRAVYIGAYKYNSHQTKPFGLYTTTLINNQLFSKKIKLQNGYAPRDIIKRENTIYVLLSKENSTNTEIKVIEFSTDDLQNYKELFSFNYKTFARSFELLDGIFYFAMGSDVDEGNYWNPKDIKNETGDILQYRWKTK